LWEARHYHELSLPRSCDLELRLSYMAATVYMKLKHSAGQNNKTNHNSTSTRSEQNHSSSSSSSSSGGSLGMPLVISPLAVSSSILETHWAH
jgi:hypothetical protein